MSMDFVRKEGGLDRSAGFLSRNPCFYANSGYREPSSCRDSKDTGDMHAPYSCWFLQYKTITISISAQVLRIRS